MDAFFSTKYHNIAEEGSASTKHFSPNSAEKFYYAQRSLLG